MSQLSHETNPAVHSEPFVVLDPSANTSQFEGLLVISVLMSAAGLFFLLAPGMPWSARIFLIAVVLLTLRFWGGFAVLIAVQLDLFFREPQRSSTFQGAAGFLTVFLIVALLMFINRNRELLRRAASRPLSAILGLFVSGVKGELTFDTGRAMREIPRMLGLTIRGIAILASCVFCSRFLLSTLPNRRSFNRDLQQWFLDEGSVARGSFLLVSMIAAWIVCTEISWRQLTKDQARLYVRSVFVIIHHADLRMVVRRGLKLRYKAARIRKNLAAPVEPLKPKT